MKKNMNMEADILKLFGSASVPLRLLFGYAGNSAHLLRDSKQELVVVLGYSWVILRLFFGYAGKIKT